MKAYPEYKPSNTVWLGAVPSHWEKTAFKYFLTQITDSSSSDNKVALENIESGTARYISTLSEFEGNGVEFKKGDILYGKLRPYLQKVWVAEFDGNAIGDFFVYRVNSGVFTEYVKWLLLSNGFTEIVNNSTEGAKMPRVSSEFIKNLVFFLPPYEEQWKIAEYLCDITGKVDALITEKNKQIEDLRTYRTSLITETVRHGLNPNVFFKDSGIDWLGKIPAHWDIIKIKYVSELNSGTNITSEAIIENGYPVFGGNGLRGFYSQYNHDGNFALIGRQGALCGNINYAKGKFWATEHAVVCHPLKEYALVWFGELLRIMNLNQYSLASAQPGLSVERIKNLPIPFPPLSEQIEIATYLEEKTEKIDTLIAELEKQLEDLVLYKKAVITEAVTGKVDVRDWTPKN